MLIVSHSKYALVSAISSGITVNFAEPDRAFINTTTALRGKKIIAVLATDDSVVELASRIAQFLHLPHNHPQSSLLTYRKDLARKQLQQSGCNVPEFHICHFQTAIKQSRMMHFPVVLKPLMLSASRGVIRADNPAEFISAADKIKDILIRDQYSGFVAEHFLVEQFLSGDEVAIDGFMQDGVFIELAIFDKPEPMNGPYFEESYYITPSRQPISVQQAVIAEISRCCKAYGLTHGPIHAEARITRQGVVLLEMAARTIGGQCAQMIEYVCGVKLEELIIQLMCFQKISSKKTAKHAGVLMIPIKQRGILKRIEGLTQAHKVKYVTNIEIHIQPGYELIPLPEGSSYLGFIFATAHSYEATLEALQEAHQHLKFITSQNWVLEPA